MDIITDCDQIQATQETILTWRDSRLTAGEVTIPCKRWVYVKPSGIELEPKLAEISLLEITRNDQLMMRLPIGCYYPNVEVKFEVVTLNGKEIKWPYLNLNCDDYTRVTEFGPLDVGVTSLELEIETELPPSHQLSDSELLELSLRPEIGISAGLKLMQRLDLYDLVKDYAFESKQIRLKNLSL